MAADWPVLSLREAGVVLIDCEHRTPPSAADGYPYIAIPQIREGRIDLTETRRITPDHFAEWTRKAKPQPNDVVLSRRCNPGESAYVPPGLECALGQNLVLLRADGRRVLPEFLRWLVRGPAWWAQVARFINVGAVFDSLKCADIPSFRLPVPPIAEQRIIARVLGTLDDKIELNHQMNGTLDTTVRVLFSAVLSFAPTDGAPRAALARLADIAFLHREGLNPLAFPGEQFEHYSLPAFDETRTPVVEFGADIKSNKLLVPPDAVLLSKLNPHIPRVWYPLVTAARRSVASTEFLVLRPRPPVTREFLYGVVCSEPFQNEFRSMAAGTTGSHQRVSPESTMSIQVALPPEERITALSDAARPLLARMALNLAQNQTLGAIRDMLLPRLISGEIRVGDVEREVATVA